MYFGWEPNKKSQKNQDIAKQQQMGNHKKPRTDNNSIVYCTTKWSCVENSNETVLKNVTNTNTRTWETITCQGHWSIVGGLNAQREPCIHSPPDVCDFIMEHMVHITNSMYNITLISTRMTRNSVFKWRCARVAHEVVWAHECVLTKKKTSKNVWRKVNEYITSRNAMLTINGY